MDALLLYYMLLVLWVPLLWPALVLRGWKRGALLVVVAAGILATVNEVWQTSAGNAIRIDIFLLVTVLTLLYFAAVAVLWLARWRFLAFAIGAVLLVTLGMLGYRWAAVMEETARVTQKLEARDALLFRAKFRNQEGYDAYFGPFGDDTTRFPVGHWQAPDKSPYTRLIVNADGWAWLFYRCGKTECAYRPANAPLERVVGAVGFEWRGLLRPLAGELLAVRIVRDHDTQVTLEARGGRTAFAKAPPPIAGESETAALTYLGAYVATTCIRKHAAVRQIWLWRQADRLFAVGVFQTLVAGQRALFVSPVAMGEGRRDGESWTFDWVREGAPWMVRVTPGADSVALRLTPPRGALENLTLSPGAIFEDDTITLAPRTSAEAWRRWFDTVWVAQFFSGTVPDCPG
jgi:hypothetical protein